MLLTKSQLTLWWRTWSAACQAQGWTRERGWTSAQIDEKRHEILTSLQFASLKNVDNRGFDRLLARVRMLSDNVNGALDEVRPSNGDARRLLWRIEWLLKCIDVYLPGHSETYVASVVADKFTGLDKYDTGVLHPPHWRDLSAQRSAGKEDSQLDHLRITLAARLNGRTGFRATSGDDLHQMCAKAGVTCSCNHCTTARDVASQARRSTPRSTPHTQHAPEAVAADVANEPF